MHYYTESQTLGLCKYWGSENKRFVIQKEEYFLYYDDYGKCIGYKKTIFVSPSEIKIEMGSTPEGAIFEIKMISPQPTRQEERMYYNDLCVFCHN